MSSANGYVRECITFPEMTLNDTIIGDIGKDISTLLKTSDYNKNQNNPIVGNADFVYGHDNAGLWHYSSRHTI